jgi:hypothetical protein
MKPTLYDPRREAANHPMPNHERRDTQTLRADPNTRATAAARKAEAKHGETEAAGEVGLGAGASTAWA